MKKIDGKKRIPHVRNALAKLWDRPVKIDNLWGLDSGWIERKRKLQEEEQKKLDKSSPFQSASTFGHKLKKRGFEQLGSGAFSTVYAKPGSTRVIKVTRNQDNWIDYIQWAAKRGYAGTFAPKVFSYKVLKTTDGGSFSVSIVERMKKTVGEVKAHEDLSLVEDLLHKHTRGNIMASIFLEELSPGITTFEQQLRKAFADKANAESSEWYGSYDGGRLDFHGGNFMVRENGTFCFTDPVCGKTKTTSNRLKAGDFTPALAINLLRVFIADSHRH